MQAGRLRIRACLHRHVVVRARVMPALAGVHVRGRRAAVLAAILRRSRHRAAALRVAAFASHDLNHAPPRVRFRRSCAQPMPTSHPPQFKRLGARMPVRSEKFTGTDANPCYFAAVHSDYQGLGTPVHSDYEREERRPVCAGLLRHVASDRMRGCARRHGRNGRRGGSAVAGSRVLLAARCRPREVRDQGQRAGPLRGADSRSRGAGCQRRLLRASRRRSTLLRDPGRLRQRASRGARLVVRRFVRGAVASAGNGDCTAAAGAGDTRVSFDRHAPARPGRVVVRRLGEHTFCARSTSTEHASIARSAIHGQDPAVARRVLVRRRGEHAVRARATVSKPIGSAGARHFGYFSSNACCARRLVVRRIREHAVGVRSAPQRAAGTSPAQHQVVSTGRAPVVSLQGTLISATFWTMRSSTPSTDSRVSASSG
jgi:hypothetical protein